MNPLTVFVDAVETAVCDRVAAGHVVTVVRKFFSRRETRSLADDFVAFDHELAAVSVDDDPFASEQSHGAVRAIFDRDEINEGVRFVGGQRRTTVVISELVESGDKPRDFT